MKKTPLLLLKSFSAALLAAFLLTVPAYGASKNTFPKDGIYSYDFERYVECVELVAMYQSYGMEAYQDILKKSFGNAVYIEDGSFIEPETRILLSVSSTGKVTSPDNPSISGRLRRNGEFFFQGYYEENSQILKIAIKGTLLYSDPASRASKKYDGDFTMTDNGTERKQKVRIEDGLYIWEYEDKQDDDFETWPAIVNADGVINCGFEMTVRSGVKGLSQMVVSSKNQSYGKVDPSGQIQLRTITQNSGTGQSGESEEISFSGTRGTQSMNKISKESSEDSGVKKSFKRNRKKPQNTPKGNPPEWYSDFIEADDNYIYGSAKKTHADKDSALKIAEITAASQIKLSLSADVQVRSESKKSVSQENSENGEVESSFFGAVDTFSNIKIPYSVKNSFYDEESKTAYVVTILPKDEAEKILAEYKK